MQQQPDAKRRRLSPVNGDAESLPPVQQCVPVTSISTRQQADGNRRCSYCRETGHYISTCPKLRCDKQNSDSPSSSNTGTLPKGCFFLCSSDLSSDG